MKAILVLAVVSLTAPAFADTNCGKNGHRSHSAQKEASQARYLAGNNTEAPRAKGKKRRVGKSLRTGN